MTLLQTKLDSLQPNQIVPEIDAMLTKASVTISWWGKRLVSVEGYKGCVEIDVLARTYLHSSVFPENLTATQESQLPTLGERLQCYNLWDKIKNLYTKSDAALKATWITWIITWFQEIHLLPYAYLRIQEVIRTDDLHYTDFFNSAGRKNSCFEFPTKIFKELFPNEKPIFAYLTYLEPSTLKHDPHSHHKFPPETPFIDKTKLKSIDVVYTSIFENLPGFKEPRPHMSDIKKETFDHFFSGQASSKSSIPYYQNECTNLVELLVTTKEVVEKAIKK
jgi:hypothetical protein